VRNRGFLGGLVLVAIGVFFLYFGWGFRTGTLTRMGPGFLPLALSCSLVAMGLFRLLSALRRPVDAPNWPLLVPTVVVALLPVAFGLLIRPLGIVVTTALVVVASRLAMRERPRWRDVIAGLVLGGFCAVTFVVALSQAMTIWPRF
jgi:hypothetical protein